MTAPITADNKNYLSPSRGWDFASTLTDSMVAVVVHGVADDLSTERRQCGGVGQGRVLKGVMMRTRHATIQGSRPKTSNQYF